MKRIFTKFGIILAVCGVLSCGNSGNNKTDAMDGVNTLTEQEKKAGILSPEVMIKMGRVGSLSLSPDGKTILYTVAWHDIPANKSNTSIYIQHRGEQPVRLTDSAGNDAGPVWSRDGNMIYFTSNRSGDKQIWSMDASGGAMKKISDIEGGIESYGVSPDGSMAFYTKKVHVNPVRSPERYDDMDKSRALVYDDLMERHWDYWDVGDYSHIFITELKNGSFGIGRDIMEGEPWDAPLAPYFDGHEIAWNNAGNKLAYTCKKLTGAEYAISTDSDIYIYDVDKGTTENITQGMVGYDKYPVFSPDDSKIAFQSMERPGNESDKNRLFVHDLATGSKTYLTRDFDYNADDVQWIDDNTLMFVAPYIGVHQLATVDLDSNVTILTEGDNDITSFSHAAGRTVVTATNMKMAAEIYEVYAQQGTIAQLSSINKETYDNIKMGDYEKRWVKTTDGKDMLVWVIFPPDFDPAKKYPTLLYCQGGPQSVVSPRWSYRWNFQAMAAQGYIVVAPNRRGLPSFGQEWLDQISGDWTGQNMKDYLSAIDNVSKEPWSDEQRLGCVGASYGGFSAFWLAGNHNKRFKGIISHCGMFNMESMYGSTEELFFVNNDMGGSYWSKNPAAQRTYANSPHKFVDRWDTPILIITGLWDFRIPYTQSLEAFTAARLKGIPSRLLVFEDEAHQVFKAQNSVVWHREFFNWLDKYVKSAE